ncbi:major facilitator superfamily domain-containing protein [Kockovaella imperatae]|uniref:Major facilitator superfamily domain-containing protein n=1 Tax=Kockovaella imperatae TaxID=4999 RepID=A0A1Y1U747_9TREE|nr:major facilitator superfamily domain-containing protein [Kockovaella imperatae]ORX33828.1 major facilitator superfamily domain-containing protein [Kockovaella imperatae]
MSHDLESADRSDDRQPSSREQPDRRTSSTTQVDNSSSNEKPGDRWLVNWDGDDDPENPLNTPLWKKWAMTAVVAFSSATITCTSSMGADTYDGMMAQYGISREVATLSVSLFVAGTGVGPLILAPSSEFIGRSKVLHYSFAAFFLLNFPVAFANNAPVHLIFRFFTGFAGSAFLSVSGGLISDVFKNEDVGTPMMVWSASPFLGPVLGPLLSGFINQNVDWHWTYYVVIIWAFVLLIVNLAVVRETYAQELLRQKAIRMRKTTGEQRWKAPVEKSGQSVLAALKKSIKTPFWLLLTQPMVLLLDIWSAMMLGILYLSFGGIPYIFEHQYGFNLQQSGMVFLGIGTGQVIAVLTQPLFNKKYRASLKEHGGEAPPEERLRPGFFGAVLCPMGLLLLGLLSFKQVPWILPIIFSSLFGAGMVLSFTSTFTYLVDAYRPVSASVLASNSFMRSAFAAGFPLFGEQMYRRLGAVGATCLLAGLMFLTTPLPFIFFRIGARIRAKSDVAA